MRRQQGGPPARVFIITNNSRIVRRDRIIANPLYNVTRTSPAKDGALWTVTETRLRFIKSSLIVEMVTFMYIDERPCPSRRDFLVDAGPGQIMALIERHAAL